MKFKTRRFSGDAIRLVGRAWGDVSQEVQELFEKLLNQVTGSIPAGFNDITPEPVTVNIPADPGDKNTGWAAANHVHNLDLGLTTKGDLLGFDGTSYVRIPTSGIPDGYVLTKDGASTPGWKWAVPTGGGGGLPTHDEDAEWLAWVK